MSNYKKIKSTIMVPEDTYKETRILAIRKGMDIGSLVDEALREKIVREYQQMGLQSPYSQTQPQPQQLQEKKQHSPGIINQNFDETEKSPFVHIFKSDTIKPKPGKRSIPGERSIEIGIELPGIRFPINKTELIDFARYLDEDVYNYDPAGFYYDLFRDLPDRTYTNIASLKDALLSLLNTSRRDFFGEKRRVVDIKKIFTTKEEIHAYYTEMNKIKIDRDFKDIDKYYKEIGKEQKIEVNKNLQQEQRLNK